ncbi:hypothetical protein PR202_ga19219 [Eleusine coracana subsp. coracana]|uniref:DNA helicase n=1 Tax=Eleusine coracana subsp. coracana TaxID=191504 RepID=A0AAV5CVU7_ELECO|nr:hypothetical protein PR202_ga19219 [Eleusine coracana subsp. coracana]
MLRPVEARHNPSSNVLVLAIAMSLAESTLTGREAEHGHGREPNLPARGMPLTRRKRARWNRHATPPPANRGHLPSPPGWRDTPPHLFACTPPGTNSDHRGLVLSVPLDPVTGGAVRRVDGEARAAAAAASKKPPASQPSQPAKFGILHFFERQTQASQAAKRQKPDPAPPPPPLPPPPPAEEAPSEVSPEVTKTLAPKRVRFSPGMLIKQSQDDGGADVVTWKVSPVNDRLRTMKSRQFPGMTLHPCSNNEQLNGGVTSKNGPEQLGAGQHKKALLDLLDQVEDAIMEEELPIDPVNKGEQDSSGHNIDITYSPVVDGDLTIPSKKSIDAPTFDSFLVLEVSEKHKVDDSSCERYPVKVLRLLNEHSGHERAVHLCDEWFHSIVGPGDTVSIIGEFSDQGKCIVDHDSNLVVVHPELLISGTRVASSFHCPRRSVLDDRLKSNEYSTSALIGTMLHQVFQAGLLEDAPSKQFLEQQAKEVLLKNIDSLYACGASERNTYSTLIEAIPKILNWFKCFLKGAKNSNVDFGRSEGRKTVGVTEVIDIEEMAWAPRYGLKGIIDASVRSKIDSCNGGSYDRIMPLEFKTGKGTSGQTAMEHSAQVILYTLLMTERYLNKDIDSGLLYYLHTDQTLGIKAKRSDLIGLIMRRNELATDILKASTSQSFPPMLQAHGGNAETSGLGDLFDSLVNHLTVAHHDFLKHWDRLIDLEARASQVKRKDLFQPHLPNYGSRNSGASYFLLDIKNGYSIDSSGKSKRYIYNFVRQKMQSETADQSEAQLDSLDLSLKCGDSVVLNTQRITVANGSVRDISCSHITVSLPRRLRLPDSNSLSEQEDLTREVWRINKDESSSSFAIMRLNLVQLFAQNPWTSHLRKLIVDLEGVDFIRIGRQEAVHPDIRAHCLSTTEMQSVDAIKARMEQVQVVGVTCLGIYHPLLAHKKFDTCIMDEAGQITLPVSLGPLMLATKFVLVGDHYQLPPLVQILNPDRAVIFANTDQIPALESKEHRTVNNPTEAHIVSWITRELIRRGVSPDGIGIITPYNAQVNLIQQCTDGLVEVHTIDKYQGRDKECIIVSFVRSSVNSKASGSLLGDWHRINVLLTRAKKKLIMVGSCGTLSKIPLLRFLVEKVSETGGLLDLTNKDAHFFGEHKSCR